MLSTLSILLLCVGSIAAVGYDWDEMTLMDQYVHADDGHYSYFDVASYNLGGVTTYIVNMTSQLYQTEEFSTRPIWWHFMGIAIPDDIRHPEHGLLFIEGGQNNDIYEPPGRADASVVISSSMANDTGMVVGFIFSVPNQPVHFYNDPDFRRRTEDNIIAWTWRTFLDNPYPSDETIIERMPMTKAAKRGLDTIAAVAKIRAPGTNIDKFFVMGASKRGWTTWSLAATDQRVIAAIPLVFSLIDLKNGSLIQHYRDMDGAYSFALNPYYRENITREIYTPKAERIYEIEDMLYYFPRFTIPILAVSSTGDEFFLPDDNHSWWDLLPGPHWFMLLPNAEHTMAPHYVQMYETTVNWVTSVVEDIPMPQVSWTLGNTSTGATVRFHTNPPPESLKAFWAVTSPNDTRRDFRLVALNSEGNTAPHPVVWRQNLEIVDEGNGNYYVEKEGVEGEWVGLFIEGTWVGPTGNRMVFTSQLNIYPNTYPREACLTNDECYGYLV